MKIKVAEWLALPVEVKAAKIRKAFEKSSAARQK